MQKLKVGIAGYGVVGKRRRIYIDQNPHMETACVSDITFPDSGKFQDGVEYFTNYKHLFQKEMDVLFVSLPNYLAAEATIEEALQNKIPVVQYDPFDRYCHIPAEKIKKGNDPDVSPIYYINSKIDLRWAIEWIQTNHLYRNDKNKIDWSPHILSGDDQWIKKMVAKQ